jgi:tetratricopeptide (TPR) repeat protein
VRRGILLLACLSLGGCVYYNGVYNARRLTKEAERAERDGRRFDAQGLYGQVATKAESVLARYPRSEWADDARFLRGNALARLRNCEGARPELEAVVLASPDPELVRRSLDVLADCYTELGQWDHAAGALARLRDGAEPEVARRAAGRLVAVLRTNGRYAEALTVLESEPDLVPPPAERAAILAGAGRSAEALALVDTILAGSQSSDAPWDSLVAALGRSDPAVAGALTDRLAVLDSLPADLRARLLLADAERWRERDTARARLRWEQATLVAPTRPVQASARMELTGRALAVAAGPDELRPMVDTLAAIGELGGRAGADAVRRRSALQQALARMDSLRPDTAGSPEGDIILFLTAESLRDSVGAARAAAGLFTLLVDRHPGSPYAPKAILARAALEPARAESLLADMSIRYPGSPYLLALRGAPADSFLALEDSLRRWSRPAVGPPGRGVPRRPVDQPSDTLQ